jgi:hypothetical protein
MSWHFSRALVGAYSEANSLDGLPSAPSKSSHTHKAHSCADKMTEASPPSQSGTTCKPSMESHGVAWWISSLAASRAKISAQPAKELGSAASGQDCGEKWHESWARFDPLTCSWKTRQFSLLGDLESFSETWPRWGMMRAGECYPQPMPSGLVELRAWITSESESGLRLPTLHGFSKDGASNGPSGNELGRAVNRMPSIRKTDADRGGRVDLIQAVRGNANKHFKRLPTTRTASKSGGGIGLDGGSGSREMISAALGEQATKELTGGSLNPPWIEWLMGWPIGWTALQPLEMDKFRQWWRSHGIFSARND